MRTILSKIPLLLLRERVRSFILIFLMMILTSSCSSVMVSHDFDNSEPFSSYSSFAFEPEDPQRNINILADNDPLSKIFHTIISEQLTDKGYLLKNSGGKTDFTVSFHYSLQPKMDLTNISTQIGFSYSSYFRHGGVGSRTCTDISQFNQGVLIIDIKNGANGQLVWKGTGIDIVSANTPSDRFNTDIHEMITSVLKPFPPQ